MRLFDLYVAKYGETDYERGNVFVMRATWNVIMALAGVGGLQSNERAEELARKGSALITTSAFRGGFGETYILIPANEVVDFHTGNLEFSSANTVLKVSSDEYELPKIC